MSQRIRGKEATIQIVIDGDLKGGSFAKVTYFNLTPRTEITETAMLGESEDDLDINHKGFDFSFTPQMIDAKVVQAALAIIARERAHTRHPSVNIVVTFEFRSETEPAFSLVLENCKMKLDSLGIGGGNDYVNTPMSGKCKVVTEL
jgi:hypothetical protein